MPTPPLRPLSSRSRARPPNPKPTLACEEIRWPSSDPIAESFQDIAPLPSRSSCRPVGRRASKAAATPAPSSSNSVNFVLNTASASPIAVADASACVNTWPRYALTREPFTRSRTSGNAADSSVRLPRPRLPWSVAMLASMARRSRSTSNGSSSSTNWLAVVSSVPSRRLRPSSDVNRQVLQRQADRRRAMSRCRRALDEERAEARGRALHRSQLGVELVDEPARRCADGKSRQVREKRSRHGEACRGGRGRVALDAAGFHGMPGHEKLEDIRDGLRRRRRRRQAEQTQSPRTSRPRI